MTDQTNSRPHLNSEGLMNAVALVMLHCGKLEKDQRVDLVSAALDALKTSLIDDLSHSIFDGDPSAEQVASRIGRLAISMEEIRHQRIGRFSNLCELLKPYVNIKIEFADGKTTEMSHAVH